MDHHTGMIYQFPCSDCPKVYVGQSGRTLSTASGNTDGHSRIESWLHRLWRSMYGPQVNLFKAEVIDSYLFVTTQYLLERWHSQCHANTLNQEKGTLPSKYMALLD